MSTGTAMDLNQHESAMLLHLIDQWPRPVSMIDALQGKSGVPHEHGALTIAYLVHKRLIRPYHVCHLRLTQQGTTQACQLLSQTQTLN
jgi:hypothetical protein